MPTFRRAANLLENTFSMCHPWGAYGDAWRSARRDDLVCPNPRDMRGEPSSKCPKRTANGSCRRGCNRRLHGAFLRYNERQKVDFDEQTPFAHVRRLRGVDRKSTRLNSSHLGISYAVFCLKKMTL